MWNGGEGTILSQSCTSRCRDGGMWYVECGTAVRARYSRKLGDFIIYYCLGQPPAEGIGGAPPPVPLSTFAGAHSDSGTGSYTEVSLRLSG